MTNNAVRRLLRVVHRNRGQIDSMGRMIGYLEHRLQPNFAVLFSGELDHFSGQARFGVGMQVQ